MLPPLDNPSQRAALELVITERQRQDKKWGQQNHDPLNWEPILHEETGEASQEVCRITWDHASTDHWLSEMVQVAAVAVAAVESELRRRDAG